MEETIIDIVTDKLKIYPNIKFQKRGKNELEIFCQNEEGFSIILQTNQTENTLYFGAFHWHFDHSEAEITEMLNQLAFGLTGIARLKEFSKKGKAYKWILQLQDIEGNWHDNGTMGFINFNFWSKSEIKYLQNGLLPRDRFYDDTEMGK